jgi:hypothetical protein
VRGDRNARDTAITSEQTKSYIHGMLLPHASNVPLATGCGIYQLPASAGPLYLGLQFACYSSAANRSLMRMNLQDWAA